MIGLYEAEAVLFTSNGEKVEGFISVDQCFLEIRDTGYTLINHGNIKNFEKGFRYDGGKKRLVLFDF